MQIGLAHFCEIHGPTSILCTQVVPAACNTCYPQPARRPLVRSPSTPQLGHGPTTPVSPHEHGRPRTTSNTPISSPTPRLSTVTHLGTASGPAASSRGPSPSGTPPASPRSSQSFTSSVPSATSAAAMSTGLTASESCRNCAITFPRKVDEKLGVTGGNSEKGLSPTFESGKKPPLRTTETIVVGVPRVDVERVGGSQSPRFQTELESASTHTHTVTYLSSRSPTQASRFSNVRQSCIRSLSCEMIPAQTGPMMFGDPQTGYTIAFVFKLSDSKARGGRRTYALLCMSMNQKALIQSWSAVTSVFQSLVHRIQHAAAERAAQDVQTSPSFTGSFTSVGSRGPESFLRRRAPGDGASQKSLADLVGKEHFFVEIHAAFVHLLAQLGKVFGYGSARPELTGDIASLSIGPSDEQQVARPAGAVHGGRPGPASPAVMTARRTSFDVPPRSSSHGSARIDITRTSPPPASAKALAIAASEAMPQSPATRNVATSPTVTGRREEEMVSRSIESRRQVAVG